MAHVVLERSKPLLTVGVDRREITPPVGTSLSGFIARTGPCEGTHDPLFATALVAHDGVSSVALVSCDAIGLGASMVRSVRAEVARRTGIPSTAQMYACTHTHGGPETGVIGSTGAADPGYVAALAQTLVEVVERASQLMRPALIRWKRGECIASHNRRTPLGSQAPVDPGLVVGRIEETSGRPVAALVHHTCHPVAAGPDNRLATADWCGVTRSLLEEAGTGLALIVNGASGDINPIMDRRGFPAVERTGTMVGQAALALWEHANASTIDGVFSKAADVPINLGALPDNAQLAELWREWQHVEQSEEPRSVAYRSAAVAKRALVQRVCRLRWGSEPPAHYTAETQVVRIGPLLIVGLPGEFFCAYGMHIKQAMPDLPVMVAGYTNDNLGYFPTRDEYARGGYEVEHAYRFYGYPAAWTADSGEAVTKQAIALLHDAAIVYSDANVTP